MHLQHAAGIVARAVDGAGDDEAGRVDIEGQSDEVGTRKLMRVKTRSSQPNKATSR